MAISNYHQKHISRSDGETERRALVKEMELKKIFEVTAFRPTSDTVKIAVLGCADKRFVKYHKSIFEKLLGKPVDMVTFDITTEHLVGEENVVQHDITTPLLDQPYDITFGHVVLKFIETEKQWFAIKSAYDALRSPGLGIFVYDLEDVNTKTPLQADGYYSVPLDDYKQKLDDEGIKYKDLQWKLEIPKMPIPIRGLEGGALVVIK